MNEHDMSELLQRATQDLTPDVGALVAGGLQRGRVRQRRRRTAVVMGAGAATVLVTTGIWQAFGAGMPRSAPVVPADTPSVVIGTEAATPTPTDTPTSTPTPTRSLAPPAVPSAASSPAAPTTTPPPTPVETTPSTPSVPPVPTRAVLAVTTSQVPPTFARLQPGDVSAPDPKSGPDSAPVVDFTWNGFGVRVGLTPDDYSGGPRGAAPADRCAASYASDSCRAGRNGAVVSTWTLVSPPQDGGTTVWTAEVFRADGWDVLVSEYNGPGKEGPVTADRPPLGLDRLVAIASSDVWFR